MPSPAEAFRSSLPIFFVSPRSQGSNAARHEMASFCRELKSAASESRLSVCIQLRTGWAIIRRGTLRGDVAARGSNNMNSRFVLATIVSLSLGAVFATYSPQSQAETVTLIGTAGTNGVNGVNPSGRQIDCCFSVDGKRQGSER